MNKFDKLYNLIMEGINSNNNFKDIYLEKSKEAEKILTKDFIEKYFNNKRYPDLNTDNKNKIIKLLKGYFIEFFSWEKYDETYKKLVHFCVDHENNKKLHECFNKFGKYTIDRTRINNNLYYILLFRSDNNGINLYVPFGEIFPTTDHEYFVRNVNLEVKDAIIRLIGPGRITPTNSDVPHFDDFLNELYDNRLPVTSLFSMYEYFGEYPQKFIKYKNILNKYSDDVKRAFIKLIKNISTGWEELTYTDHNEPWTIKEVEEKEKQKKEIIKFIEQQIDNQSDN